MSLSVSSFPEAPPKPARHPKWQETLFLKCSGKHFGTFFSKRSVPFLKGIGDFAKTHAKATIIHLRVPPSRPRHPSPRSKSSIQPSSIVIDIIPNPNNDEYFFTRRGDVDTPSPGPTIEIIPSTPITPVAVSTPFPMASMTDPVKALRRLSLQYSVGDCPQIPEKDVVPPANEHEEAASVVYDSESQDSHDSEATITLPISPSPMTQSKPPAAPSRIARRRSRSVPAGVKASANETAPPTRPRYKSETSVGLRRSPTSPDASSSSEGRGRGKSPTPQLPAGSTHASSILKQRQQRRETRSLRTHSSASTRSRRSIEAEDFPLPSPPLPSLHMRSMLSGSRLPGNHVRSKMGDGASTQSRSPPLEVDPSDGAPLLPPLPSSVDRGQWSRPSAIPRAESRIPVRDGERQ